MANQTKSKTNIQAKKKTNKAKTQFVSRSVKTINSPPLALSMRAVEQVCSINDPFCPAANGAKYQDLGKVRSLAYASHTSFTTSTDANGNVGFLVLPNYNNNQWVFGTTSGTTFTPAAFMTTNVPIAGAESYRIVSFGFKIRSIVAPLSASGLVRVRTFNALTGVSLIGVDNTTYNCDQYEDVPLNTCKELAVVLGRLDVTAKSFGPVNRVTPGSSTTNWVTPGFQSCLVSVVAGPASLPVLNVEFVVNFELTFEDSTGLAQAATPSAIYSPMVSAAMDTVASEARSIFKNGAEQVKTVVMSAAKKALMSAIRARLGPAAAPVMILD